jgi:F0F1-type ATP synthase epsilon subunit
MRDALRFILRTPHGNVFDAPVASVRLPLETGQLGLRPHMEPEIAVVEPGLILIRGALLRFAASAGGLLRAGREEALLLTPFAVVGSEAEVLAALQSALATPDSEVSARRGLGELEQRLLRELRQRPSVPHARSHV